jgi:hypothetical protein
MQIPISPWRPAQWLTTDFIQPDNIAVKEQAAVLKRLCRTDDEFVEACAVFVRDGFVYPNKKNGEPSAGLIFKRYDKGNIIKSYCYNQTMDYAWGFPNETLKLKRGICIDTALLMTSLLLAGGVPSKCALGAVVNAKTGEVAGYHAWSTFIYKDEPSADETTIHFEADTITRLTSVYDPNSDWASTNGIWYRQEAEFDDKLYGATGKLGVEMVSLMGVAPVRTLSIVGDIKTYGLQDALERLEAKRKFMAREWSKADTLKQNILNKAYGAQALIKKAYGGG